MQTGFLIAGLLFALASIGMIFIKPSNRIDRYESFYSRWAAAAIIFSMAVIYWMLGIYYPFEI